MKIPVEKTTQRVLICHKCGKKHRSIYPTDGKVRCSECNVVLFGHKRIPEEAWNVEEVDAIRCDRCRQLLPCPTDHLRGFEFEEISCYNSSCEDILEGIFHTSHRVAIQYEDSWYPPEDFLFDENQSGIVEALVLRDRITLDVLNMEAKKEDFRLRPINETVLGAIYWKEGKAIGYYTYTAFPEHLPTLRQIFTKGEENRHKGVGSEMMKHFLNRFSPNGEKVAIESPNEKATGLLRKMGESTDGKGRIQVVVEG